MAVTLSDYRVDLDPVATLRFAAELLRDWPADLSLPEVIAGWLTPEEAAGQLEQEANALALHVHAWTSTGMHPCGMWGVAARSPELLGGLIEESAGDALTVARAVLNAAEVARA